MKNLVCEHPSAVGPWLLIHPLLSASPLGESSFFFLFILIHALIITFGIFTGRRVFHSVESFGIIRQVAFIGWSHLV